MVRLCTHHQKQFIRVLSDIYTEGQPGSEGPPAPGPQAMDVATCSQPSPESRKKSAPCCELRPPPDSDRAPLALPSPLCTAGPAPKPPAEGRPLDRTENFSSAFKRDFSELAAPRASAVSPKDCSAHGYLTASNSQPQPPGHEPDDDKEQSQGKTLADKGANGRGAEGGAEGCLPFRAFPEEGWDSGFPVSPPRRADKENALQCSSKAALLQELETSEQDARPKQESHLHALGKTRAGGHGHAGDKSPCEGWLGPAPAPAVHKASGGRSRTKAGASAARAARKNKRASGLRINDYDNQCDVVYISQPITECRTESQRPAGSRRTARKSTRGYYFNGECCELPTVRTLARGSRGEDRGPGPARRPEAGVSAEGAQAAGREAEKRTSLRLLSPGAAPSREAEKEPGPGSALGSREAARPEPLLAPHADSPPEGGSATSPPLANGPPAADGRQETTCQLLQGPEASQAGSSADPCGDAGPTERSREAADSTPLSAPQAAGGEQGSEIQLAPAPPAGPAPAPPAGTDQEPPMQLSVTLGPEGPETLGLERLGPEALETLGPEAPEQLGPEAPEQLGPEALESLGPEVLGPEAPESLGPEVPEQLGSEVLGPEAPETLGLEAPETLGPEAPEQLGSEAPESLGSEAPEQLGSEAPEQLGSEAPEQLGSEAPEQLGSEAPESLGPEAPESLGPEVPEQLEPKSLESLGPEPANLLSAEVPGSAPPSAEAKGRGVRGSPPGQGEALPATAKCSRPSARESAAGGSRPSDGHAGEMPPGADSSEPGGQGATSPGASPERKQKKGRRALVASDRRLRSQQCQPPPSAAPTALQLPCLQIRLLKRPGAKRFRREVQLHGAASVCFPQGSFHKALLRNIQAPGSKRALGRGPKQRGRGEGGMTTRQTYRSRLANEGAVAREGPSREGSPTTGGPSQSGEKLEICVEANSDKRSVLLPRDSGAGAQGAEQSARKAGDGDAPADTAVDTGQVQQQDLSSSPPGARGKSGSKAPPAKSWKHKSLALPVYNLRHSPAPLEAAKKSPEALQVTPSQQEEASSGHPDPLGWKEVDPPAEDRPKFVEWCAEEETQELIADFNAQYARVQRGWIQLEREAQPAPKAKNKADKLKEIWKSKKRTRKCRASLEAQKLSPVQMLFLKAFKLSNVCRWFLETTETRSLVIVKKLNTRLPGDVPPIKIPLQKFCSAGLYPSSLQAERLKKHLKKFAAATPAKNNLKNQKLWARLREGADRAEPEGAASPSQPAPCKASSGAEGEERKVQPPPSLPAQASTRILRKYSNLRGKLRAQQRLGRGEGAAELSSVESKPSRKSVCINPLMSPKLALQVKADVFPAKPAPAEAAAKGRKGKSRPQEGAPPKAAPRPGRKRTLRESSGVPGPSPSSSRDRPPAPKGSKAKAPAPRKQAAVGRSQPPERRGSVGERRAPGRQLGKGRLPLPKVKGPPPKRAAPPPSHEGPSKSPKAKPGAAPSARSHRAAEKPSGGKALTRSMKKVQESSAPQGKRKSRAKGDSAHSKRPRPDAK
ncbi:uncharacterized protein LOC102449756 [Pelodiscus sinensis]|uniref:uncharacterized protein LOC102449756 n=1 Tax=Pelodiscus sinensis TaxID=13735 RepID=UPI003F6C98EE